MGRSLWVEYFDEYDTERHTTGALASGDSACCRYSIYVAH